MTDTKDNQESPDRGWFSTDTEMLNWLQKQNDQHRYTGRCLFRLSTTGRGWRLYETSKDGAGLTVRGAIRAAMLAEKLRELGDKL